MKDLVHIASMGINDLIKQFPDKEDLIRFPNISPQYFGELLNKYFSFAGFYTIDDIHENSYGKKIKLTRLKGNKKIINENYKIFNIIFPHTSALQSFSKGGVSVVEGELKNRKFEGTLSHTYGKKYSIYISKEE